MSDENHMYGDMNTLLIHGGISEDEATGALSIPIYQSSTFRQTDLGKHKGFEYGRTGNPTRKALEALIADLEQGNAGFAFASGLAALTTVLMLFKTGDRILISQNVYGGTFRILANIFSEFGITYKFVDTTNAEEFKTQIQRHKETRGVLIETPANPLLTVTDIKTIAAIAKQNEMLTIVDNTFMTPYLQKPLTYGADIVVHSGTKYLGGHSDVVSGLAVVKDETLANRLKFLQNAAGAVLGPFDSWLLMRGIKTLGVRMERHCENAAFIADYLSRHEGVENIYYPGVTGRQAYNIHRNQAAGYGGMISFTLAEGYDIGEFFKHLKLIALAESLGGVESLICHPATMTHASIPVDKRKVIGIHDNLIRLSVGIEGKEDIMNDLTQAFKSARREAAV